MSLALARFDRPRTRSIAPALAVLVAFAAGARLGYDAPMRRQTRSQDVVASSEVWRPAIAKTMGVPYADVSDWPLVELGPRLDARRGSSARTVLVAAIDADPAWARLAAPYLARAPVLFVSRDLLPDGTSRALEAHDGAVELVLVGSESVISPRIANLLGTFGTVHRAQARGDLDRLLTRP